MVSNYIKYDRIRHVRFVVKQEVKWLKNMYIMT